MPRKNPTAHVVMEGNTFTCRHCGERYTPALPAPVDLWVAMSQAWVKLHRRCPAPDINRT